MKKICRGPRSVEIRLCRHVQAQISEPCLNVASRVGDWDRSAGQVVISTGWRTPGIMAHAGMQDS